MWFTESHLDHQVHAAAGSRVLLPLKGQVEPVFRHGDEDVVVAVGQHDDLFAPLDHQVRSLELRTPQLDVPPNNALASPPAELAIVREGERPLVVGVNGQLVVVIGAEGASTTDHAS